MCWYYLFLQNIINSNSVTFSYQDDMYNFYLLSCATKPVSLACYCKGSNFIEECIYLQLTALLLFNM